MRRASSCGSNRWSHRLPSFPSMRRNLVPGAMPCASRVSFGITILPARSTGTTVVINGTDTISSISWYRRHDRGGSDPIRVEHDGHRRIGRHWDRELSDLGAVLGLRDSRGNDVPRRVYDVPSRTYSFSPTLRA